MVADQDRRSELTMSLTIGATRTRAATAPRPSRKRRRLSVPPGLPFQRLAGPVLAVLLWWLSSTMGWLNPQKLPSPGTVLSAAHRLWSAGTLQQNFETSLRRAALGLVLGVIAAVVLALVSGLTRPGDALIDGLVQVKRAIPTLALIPMGIIWLGIGESMKVTIIALSVFVPVYINTHAGLRGMDKRYVELAETLHMSRARFIRRVVLPACVPNFMVGLRLGITLAWTGLVVVEQVNATSGIGFMMTQARTYGQTNVVILGLVIYGVLGFISDTVIRLIEGRVLRWRPSANS